MPKPDTACEPLRDFRITCNMNQDSYLYGKATGNSLVEGHKLSGVGISGNHPDGENGVSQVDGDSDMVPACLCC